jgi:hypothetical protein
MSRRDRDWWEMVGAILLVMAFIAVVSAIVW